MKAKKCETITALLEPRKPETRVYQNEIATEVGPFVFTSSCIVVQPLSRGSCMPSVVAIQATQTSRCHDRLLLRPFSSQNHADQ